MRPAARGAIGLAFGACALAAVRCTLITHATEYQVTPHPLECQLCTGHPELRRPPCPPTNAPEGTARRLNFALRSLDLGVDPTEPGYHAGLNLDCADRPGGVPTTCIAVVNRANPWVPLPLGIDNSLGAQYFAALRGEGFDIEGALNEGLAQGQWGAVLVLDGWNGLPDDASVQASLIFSSVTDAGTPPTWGSMDTWTYCAIASGLESPPERSVTGGTAYVVGGVFVWDFQAPAEIYLWNHGAQIDITLLRGVLMGNLSMSGLTGASLSGAWAETTTNIPAPFAAMCDDEAGHAFECARVTLPSDLRLATDPPGQAECTAASVGVAMEFVATGTLTPVVAGASSWCPTPANCTSPPPSPCSPPEGGTD